MIYKSRQKSTTMKRKFPGVFLLFQVSLILILFVSCGPAVLPETVSAIQTPGIACPPEDWPCPSDRLTLTAQMEPVLAITLTKIMLTDTTLTAAMGSTLAAIPPNTPPPWATIVPVTGDLGWGSIYGTIIDGASGLPLNGATVKCEHFSYTSPYLCNGTAITDEDGNYAFTDVFFHDTDHITLFVEAPGYVPLRFEQDFFTWPEFNANLGLFPVTDGTLTSTPIIVMCTQPACSGGVLVCGSPNGCPAGCGAICLPVTSTP